MNDDTIFIIGDLSIDHQEKKFNDSSIKFDGSSCLKIETNFQIKNKPFVIDFYLKLQTISNDGIIFFCGPQGFYINETLSFFLSDGTVKISNQFNLRQSEWYHISVVRSFLNKIIIFVNGDEICNVDSNENFQINSFEIGGSQERRKWINGWINNFNFFIDNSQDLYSPPPGVDFIPVASTGVVTFPNGSVANGVTVRFYDNESGSFITETVTDAQGRYKVFVKPGIYYVTTHIPGWENTITGKNVVVS